MGYTFQDVSVATYSGVVRGLNDAGELVGHYDYTNGNVGIGFTGTPAYYSNDFITSLPPYSSFQVSAVNDQGVTGGLFVDAAGNYVGYILDNGTLTQVVDPNTPPADTAAGNATNQVLGINSLLVAVGYRYEESTRRYFGYIYNLLSNSYTPFTLAGATNVVPHDINDAGTIVGDETVAGVAQGFIDVAGAVTSLTGPAGATATYALALNNVGQVAGYYDDTAGNGHGFIYDIASATYTTVDEPNAAGFTSITGINDQGQIAGVYDSGNYSYGYVAAPQGIETVTNPIAGLTLAVGYGSTGLAVGGANAVTLLNPGYDNMTFYGNAGNDTFVLAPGSNATGDVWVGGPGNNTFFDASAGYPTETPTATIFLGGGDNTVVSDGETEVLGSTGTDTVFDPRLVFGGSGGSMTVVTTTSFPVVVGGAGAMTAFFGAAGAEVFGGTGQGIFFGSGDSFVVGDGPSAVYAGADAAVYLEGAASVTVQTTAASGSDVGIIGAGSAGADVFVLGAANTYLTLGSGPEAVFQGSGITAAYAGAGSDAYEIVDGHAGGELELNGFRPGTDIVQLQGYSAPEAQIALANATVVNGSTFMQLTDGTKLDFLGLTGLTSHVFG